MTDRADRIDAFLDAAGWSTARRLAVAGDLSARNYVRLLQPDGRAAMLMDAAPEIDASTPAFVAMTQWLRRRGLSAPEILAADTPFGLLLLEDLGDNKVSALVAAQTDLHDPVYELCIDLLLFIRNQAPPELSKPDAAALIRMTGLADDFYPGLDVTRLQGVRPLLETIFAELLGDRLSLSLRDFHAENLMWLPERDGIGRLGLLDYQDAFITHPVYDLVSLLTDARTEISREFRERIIERYATRSSDDVGRLRLAFAAFSVQRNLRILGIFARAARQFGKTAHLSKLPRVHAYFAEALEHPVFAAVRAETLAAVPAPDTRMVEALT